MSTTSHHETADPLDQSVRRVLAQLPVADGGAGDWTFRRFATGGQATLFRASRPLAPAPHASSSPDAGGRTVVVKIFKPSVLTPASVTQDEFESLSRLHERLDGTTLDGWHIHVPQPLLQSASPFGMIVTHVPGTALSTLLQTAPEPHVQAAIESTAPAIYAALQRYWAGEPRLYGDLRLNNILCDPATRQLSLIDPGKPFDAFHCEGVTKEFYPASRDLAYLLYSAAVSVRATLRHPGARRRMVAIAESVLRVALQDTPNPSRRAALLKEIVACGDAHLQMIHVAGRGPGALWRRLVRHAAARCLHRSFARLAVRETGTASPAAPPATTTVPAASC